MTMVILERKTGLKSLDEATAYLRGHGFPHQHLYRDDYNFPELIMGYPFLEPHSSGRLDEVVYAFELEGYFGTVSIMPAVGGPLIETTVYGPGVVTGTALPSNGARRRAVRL